MFNRLPPLSEHPLSEVQVCDLVKDLLKRFNHLAQDAVPPKVGEQCNVLAKISELLDYVIANYYEKELKTGLSLTAKRS